MNRICKVICCIWFSVIALSSNVKAIDVIPRPASVSERQGEYLISNNIGIYANGSLDNEISSIAKILEDEQGVKTSKVTSAKRAGIRLLLNQTLQHDLGIEGYRL